MRSEYIKLSILACMAGMLLPALTEGQYFGRNKVLWERFDFEILETEHFEIHYYPPDAPSAEYVARIAERWYQRLSTFFDHDFEEQKPLIIYQDHADFQQTTTTSGLVGEGTGGFTESVQNRVVLPLTGINADNDHVIGHELVHAFQFDMAQRARQEPGQQQAQPRRLPLWMIEGLAEYLSQGRHDPQTAMHMRDAVLHETLPVPGKLIQRRPSPYQYGQAVWAYIGGKWGDAAVRDLFTRAARAGLSQALEDVLGTNEEQFFSEVHAALSQAYGPILDGRQEPAAFAEPLLTAGTTGAAVNIAPSLSPDGSRVAFLSTREFAMELFLADAETGELQRKLIRAEANPHFDNLSFLDSSVAWSADGSRFAFGVFAEGERRLAIYDVERGEIERRIDLPGIKGMRHPTWSPDGTALVFSAVVEGASDLYRVELATNRLERLTDDAYTAIQPVFSPDGERIAFVTDRGPGSDLELLQFGELQLATLDLETREIEVLPIFERGKHVDPHFSPDGESLYFVGEPEGAPDLFRYDFRDGRITRLAAPKTGVSGITSTSPAISVAAETGTIALSVPQDGDWSVYRLTPGKGTPVGGETSASAAGQLPPIPPEVAQSVVENYLRRPEMGLPPPFTTYPKRNYASRVALANIGPATIGVGTAETGTFGGGSFGAYFSDTLSRHQIATTIQGGSSRGAVLDFEDTFGGEVTYLNQTRRFQWGAQVSRLPYLTSAASITRETVDLDGTEVPADVVNRLFQIVTVNRASMLGQYPLSVNDRFEVAVGASRIDFEAELERTVFPEGVPAFREEIGLQSPAALDLRRASFAYVRDTSRFGFVSPLSGMRLRAETGWTTGDLDYRTSLIDFRRYFLKRPVTFALRAMHVGRRGEDADDPRLPPLDIARSSLVRGYSFDNFDVSECTRIDGLGQCPELDRLVGTRIAVLNFELRVPLLGNEDYGIFDVPVAPTELLFFIDAGAAWSSGDSVELTFDRNSTERVPVVSAGIGARMMVLGQFPLELYYAYPYQRPNADAEFGFRIRAGW